MGRKKVFDGELVSIGAKVTKSQAEKMERLQAELGMNSRSELLRAALEYYSCNPPRKFGESSCITDASKLDFDSLSEMSSSVKELEISLNDTLSKFDILAERFRLYAPVPHSYAECPEGR